MRGILAIAIALVSMVSSASAAPTNKTIVDIAAGDSKFSTLVELVKEAGLAETLSGPGPFTLFAPTNEAFSKVDARTLAALKSDKTKLASVLKYHVVPGKVMAKDVTSLNSATSVQGSDIAIAVKSGKVMVDEATVTATDISGSNGVIHVIDSVILPANEG
jgi:uncharacterized surface protein with fasciclin (FAS1) repeats